MRKTFRARLFMVGPLMLEPGECIDIWVYLFEVITPQSIVNKARSMFGKGVKCIRRNGERVGILLFFPFAEPLTGDCWMIVRQHSKVYRGSIQNMRHNGFYFQVLQSQPIEKDEN